MSSDLTLVLLTMLTLSAGSVLGYFARQSIAKRQLSTAEGKAEQMTSDAAKRAENIVLEAKKKSVQILEETKQKEKDREDQILRLERRIESREEALDKRNSELDRSQKAVEKRAEEVQAIRVEAEKTREEEMLRLQKIAGLSKEDAKNILFQLMEEENQDVIVKRMAKLQKEGEEEMERKAMSVMAQVIQRYSRSHVSEFTTTTVQLPSDDVKGKIIGKEGRNIRTLEKLTGVELIVDDTPETVLISGFDPVRRETAKIALEKLIADGRIHPARIEEVVEEAKKQVDENIREAGETAAYDAGVPGLHPKLLYILGRLRFRYSYKQNVLTHSLEVSAISGALASELGGNVAVAKKAGLLHDIGKAVDHEIEGTHVKIGIRILEKFGVAKEVAEAMRCHHDEFPHSSLESYIVTAADAISAARPGARKETAEKYIKRLEELEALINTFDEVERSYALSAGREVRIFVSPEKTNDLGAMKLAKDISKRIEEELKYPGEIRVIVFREMRAVEYAR